MIAECEKKYQALMDNASDAILMTDAKGNVIEVNRKAVELFGYSNDEFLKKNVREIHPKEELEKIQATFTELLKKGYAAISDASILRKDTSVLPVDITCSVIEVDGKKIAQAIIRDISMRKVTEEALLKSEERYRKLFTNMTDAVIVVDPDTYRIIDVNGAACRIYGYSRNDFMELTILDVADDVKKVKGIVDDIRAGKLEQKASPRVHKRKDGSLFDAEITSSRIDIGGKLMVCAIVRDVTEARRSAEVLKRSEEQYRIIVETATEGIFAIDNDDRITFANKRIGEMSGYGHEELIGKEIFELMDDEWKVSARSDIEKLRRGGHERHDFKFMRKDGSDLWVVVSATPFFDDRHQYAGALYMATGISERKRAEEASREVENRYRKLMEMASDAIFLADAETGIIIDANKKAEELIGLPLERIIGMHQSELHPKENRKMYMKLYEQHTKDGQAFSNNIILLRSDGRHIPVEIRASLVRIGSKKVMQGIFRDMTERIAAEDKLRLSEDRLRAILNNSVALIYGRGMDGRYLFVNKTFEKLFHLKEKKAIANTPYDIFTSDIADMFQTTDMRVLETGQALEAEETLPLPDGIHTYSSSKFPLRDSLGRIYAMCSIATDITRRNKMEKGLITDMGHLEEEVKKRTAKLEAEIAERKRAEAEAYALKQQIEFILGVTKTGLDIIDSKYNIRYIDPEWKKVYGDPKGRKCYEYFMGRKGPCPCCGVTLAIRTKKPVVTQEILAKEGNRHIEVTTIPFKSKEGEWLVAEVNVDITERKKIEEEQRKNDTGAPGPEAKAVPEEPAEAKPKRKSKKT